MRWRSTDVDIGVDMQATHRPAADDAVDALGCCIADFDPDESRGVNTDNTDGVRSEYAILVPCNALQRTYVCRMLSAQIHQVACRAVTTNQDSV